MISQALNFKIKQMISREGIPLKMAGELAGLSSSEVLDWWRQNEKPLCEKAALDFLSRLDLTPGDLHQNAYDPKVLRFKLFREPFHLPATYAQHALSYSRTSAHIIETLRLTLGATQTHQILLSLGVNPGFFDRLDNRINLQFFVDLLSRLKSCGATSQQISLYAHSLPLTLGQTDLGLKFRAAKSLRALYQVLAEHSPLFDSNFSYEFRIRSDSLEIESSPSEEALDSWSGAPPFSEELFLYRQHLFGAFPLLARLPPLPVRILFFDKGSLKTCYRMEFPKPRHLRLLD